jgi:RHS repeat-associated protein
MRKSAVATLASAGSISTTQAWQSSILDSVTGLYYVIARWYSPALGRFLSVDPVAGNGSSPQTLDRYAYGAGDSINRVDPDGRVAVCRYGAEDCGELAGAHHGTRTLADVQRDHPGVYRNCGAYSGQAQQECEKARQQSATGATGGSGTTPSGSCTYLGGGSQLYCVSGRYDGSQMITTSTTTWGEWTSTTSTTTWGMTTSTTVSNTTGGVTTTTTSNSKTGQAASRDCGPAGVGCFDPGQAVSNIAGTANQVWQNTGGAAVNAVCSSSLAYNPAAMGMCFDIQHPAAALSVALLVAACAAGPNPFCVGIVLGGIGSAIGYGMQHRDLSKWRLDDLAGNVLLGEVVGATVATAAIPPFAPGVAFAAVAVPVEVAVGNHLLGQDSAWGNACQTVTSFIPGGKGFLSGLLCNAAP